MPRQQPSNAIASSAPALVAGRLHCRLADIGQGDSAIDRHVAQDKKKRNNGESRELLLTVNISFA